METQPYTNREMDMKFAEVKDMLNAQNADLKEIRVQTTTTNGKVAKVTDDFNKWKWLVTGFCLCITILLLPLIFSLIQAGKI